MPSNNPETNLSVINPINSKLSTFHSKNGRRSKNRISWQLPAVMRIKNLDQEGKISGIAVSAHDEGLAIKLDSPLPRNVNFAYIEISTQDELIHLSGYIVWVNESRNKCGIKLEKHKQSWLKFISDTVNGKLIPVLPERRSFSRRLKGLSSEIERRKSGRRFEDLHTEPINKREQLRIKKFLRNKATTYTKEMIDGRREWLSEITETELKHIGCYSEFPREFKGKIESPIGVAHVPIGICGPLKVNGDHAKGVYFVPMATTEGALITSYTFGSNIITKSGGANVKILKDELKSDPTFVFKNSSQAISFTKWLNSNTQRLREIAESTSQHLKLIRIKPFINGRRVIVNFNFTTGDAMGMNMAYKATDIICKMIRESVNPEEFWLHSNFSSIKKTSAHNFLDGYGKTIMADVTIPRQILEIIKTTPEEMEQYYYRALLGSTQGLLFGINGHFANAMTAIAIACGQDAALVANTHGGIITCEVTKSGDLYYSASIPSLFAATVGGGTSFGTAKECLEVLGCYGKGKSSKLAEIIAATVLAGEISITASIVNNTYIYAHERFGRNPPQIE